MSRSGDRPPSLPSELRSIARGMRKQALRLRVSADAAPGTESQMRYLRQAADAEMQAALLERHADEAEGRQGDVLS